ncbi:hypothetical protein [Sulfitobacter sp. M23508]|uniref:hypothetical protein n=1 Tax=Sulfitobacter sp. M23508 TaxID=3368577 RepID=UPI00374573CE
MKRIREYFDTAEIGIQVGCIIYAYIPIPVRLRIYANEAALLLIGFVGCGAGFLKLALNYI